MSMSGKTRKAKLIISLVLIVVVLVFAAMYFSRAELVTGNFASVESVTVNEIDPQYGKHSLELGRSEDAEALFEQLNDSRAKRNVGDDHTFLHDPKFEIVITYNDGNSITVLPTENMLSLYRVVVAPTQENDYKLVYVMSENPELIAEIVTLIGNNAKEDN